MAKTKQDNNKAPKTKAPTDGLNYPLNPGRQYESPSPEEMKTFITTLVERKADRIKKDIKAYRNALRYAESYIMPNRLPLYSVWQEISEDPHVYGIVVHGIIDRVCAQAHRIVNTDGVIHEDMDYFFHGEWFYELVAEVVWNELWGHTAMMIHDIIEDPINPGKKILQGPNGTPGLELIPRRNVKPELGYIVVNEYDFDGYDFRNDPALIPYVVEFGHPKSLGGFVKLAVDYLIKKNNKVVASEYSERFGLPFTVVKTQTRDNMDLDRIEGAIKDLSKGGYGIFHEGESIQVEGIKGGAMQTPFDTQIARANSELSKGIVGVTMTADNGSSKSQSETHLEIHNDVIEAVKRKVTVVVMNRLVPKLMMRGLDFKNLRFEYVEQKDLSALFDRTIKLVETGKYKVPGKFVNDTFGVPVEEIEAPKTETTATPVPDPTDDPLDPEPPKKTTKRPASKKA